MITVYEKLKMLREQVGLSMKQISEYLDVPEMLVSKIESGEENLSVDQLESLANLYGCSLPLITDMSSKTETISFGCDAKDLNGNDLRNIADIRRIALNSCFMEDVLIENGRV